MQTERKAKIREYRFALVFDAVTTVVGSIGTFLSHFWFDNADWFLICGMISCFSLYNFADSHEKYTELMNDRKE